jgi:hypothetical protein
MYIEVFKTDIPTPAEALAIIIGILENLSGHHITVDLDDCDKVLRIASRNCELAINTVLDTAGKFSKNVTLLDY